MWNFFKILVVIFVLFFVAVFVVRSIFQSRIDNKLQGEDREESDVTLKDSRVENVEESVYMDEGYISE
jgi:flagellar biosynthesis/type III secretory pathway M-ring protein FliF/YscJ